MGKNKGKQLDLLYTSNKKTNKNNSKKPKTAKTYGKEEKINLNNEIIIGMTPKKEKLKKSKTKKQNKIDNIKKKKNVKKKSIKKATKRSKIIKWTTLFLLAVVAVIIFMLSDVFNINQIIVENNEKVPKEEIIALSGLTTDENIFKVSTNSVEENIKKNPYIASAKVKRNLLGTITIQIKERKATYMLEFINAYVYVDNQGYMLEISNQAIEGPILTGITTKSEEIKEGGRLEIEDLKKLDDINQIMETAKNKKIGNLITKIDITDSDDYLLTISSEEKIVHFADTTNVNTKILLIISILEQEKGNKGEIFLNNIKKAFFRESVGGNNII